MIIYFDTSALLKRYLDEDGSDEVNDLFLKDNLYGSLSLTQVEMSASFQKAVRMKLISANKASDALKDFLEDWQSFTRLRVTAAVIEKATDIAWKYSLRGYDSLHLASALLWQETLDVKITFAAFDNDLLLACHKADLETWTV
jgi:predicted nucleic acid-binding protein